MRLTSCPLSLSCEAAYGGPQCDQLLDFNILYVVPSGQKLHYVLIAAIIGAVQIAVIVAVVMCFTRYSLQMHHHHVSVTSCSLEILKIRSHHYKVTNIC